MFYDSQIKTIGFDLTQEDQVLFRHIRGGEWYLEKRGSRKILAGSRNLGSVFDKSRSLIFVWFVFTFVSLETFYQRVSGSDFKLGSRCLGESRILPLATPYIVSKNNEAMFSVPVSFFFFCAEIN